LIIHENHINGSNGKKNYTIEKWEKNRDIKLYISPRKINDDLFWILASLNLNNSFVITNDQMRDHHNNVFTNEKAFFSWRSKYTITYEFDYDYENRKIDNVKLNYPPKFTTCFQEFKSLKNRGFHIPYYQNDRDINYDDIDSLESINLDDFKTLEQHSGKHDVDILFRKKCWQKHFYSCLHTF
jgi:hypothetical protein